jgi:hypothetical protein
MKADSAEEGEDEECDRGGEEENEDKDEDGSDRGVNVSTLSLANSNGLHQCPVTHLSFHWQLSFKMLPMSRWTVMSEASIESIP